MKKLMILFLSLTLLTACSSDDDNVVERDPILGTWILTSSTAINPGNCEQESTLTFNQDNSASGTFYIDQLNCAPQSSAGSWENLGDSRYSVTVPFIGDLTGTATFSGNDEFTFTTTAFGSFDFQRQ